MKHNILKILSLVGMMLCISNVSAIKLIKVAEKVITIDGEKYYSVTEGYKRRDTLSVWKPFGGKFKNFDVYDEKEERYEYIISVDSFDINLDTIVVNKILGRESIYSDYRACPVVRIEKDGKSSSVSKDEYQKIQRNKRLIKEAYQRKKYSWVDSLKLAKENLLIDSIQKKKIELISVAPFLMYVNKKCCFLTKRRGDRYKNTEWEPFCGEFSKPFYYERNKEFSLLVKNYDPKADTIQVIRCISSDSSIAFRKLQLKRALSDKSNYLRVRVDGKLYYWTGRDYEFEAVEDVYNK